ncbi:putative Disease resistance protein [Quillaja saponaria]|uniref:Disease resistance protein n=1 Tax=Quillaja saponaria TaxID=32244 RepID=A0AAD7PNQ2_QUISA|nr:putative Disease resistance protein [Quillaja saponaria]
MKEVPSSIANLAQLSSLKLSYCESLQNLPSIICELESLRKFHLGGCLRLEKFPEMAEPMENLRVSNCPSLMTVSSPREAISKLECKSFSYDAFTMDLTNCHPYADDNILRETRIAVKYCSVEKTLSEVKVNVPGSEIPKWFPYQSNGPSLTIKWIPSTPGRIQFIFCTVLTVEERKHVNKFIYQWEIKIGDRRPKRSPAYSDVNRFFEKEHMIVSWYYYYCEDRPSDSLLWCNSDGYQYNNNSYWSKPNYIVTDSQHNNNS